MYNPTWHCCDLLHVHVSSNRSYFAQDHLICLHYYILQIYYHECIIDEIHDESLTTTETLIYPGWETLVVPVSQPGTPDRDKGGSFCPGSGNRDKNRDIPFFPVFIFSILFLFQLYFCISIKLIYLHRYIRS